MEQLFAAGARDVYTQPIGMKKSRPGILLCVICLPQDAPRLAKELFKHTSTLGVRRQDMERYLLHREIIPRKTPLGEIRIKTAEGYGVRREKPEYEDIARLARENDASLHEVKKQIKE